MRKPAILQALTLLLLGLAAAYWHGNEDLWNDEIYTLKSFVFKGLPTVLTDYHVPNNHILANVLHWLWVRLTGADFGDCMDSPWRIRLLPGLLSAFTVILLVRTAARHWGAEAGFAAGLALLTGISFQAFAFQVRGYPLTLLAASGLLFFALQVLQEKVFSWKNATVVAALTAALLWAIPSNLYFVLVTALLVPLVALLSAVSDLGTTTSSPRPTRHLFWGKNFVQNPALGFAVAVLAGMVLAALLYAPVLGQMLRSQYLAGGQPFQASHWENSEKTLRHFISWRWPLLPLLLWGGYKILIHRTVRRRALLLLAGVLFLPFLISAARGDAAPMRSYLVQLPAFVLLAALGWAGFREKSQP